MRKITFDIETTGSVGSFDPTDLTITVVGIHDSQTDEFRCFTVEELPLLWPILERADVLIGYNSEHFDIPILNKYYSGDLRAIRSVDLMKEVKNVLGRRLRLDNLAEATLGKKKSGNGLQAIQWWKDGLHEKVKEYCLDDVRITRDLYAYVLKNGHVKYRDFDGIRDIKIDTSLWEKVIPTPALTHTLPF